MPKITKHGHVNIFGNCIQIYNFEIDELRQRDAVSSNDVQLRIVAAEILKEVKNRIEIEIKKLNDFSSRVDRNVSGGIEIFKDKE